MDKLQRLIQLCKCGVHLTINGHRDYYETVEDHISEDDREEIDSYVFDKMNELDTIIEIQYYPDTPVGSYTVHHYDLDSALDEALSTFKINA